ncbi:gamma-glutamylcyclotransferase family protein [uncultured Litoreibacter sp.]|uniref:gamma-glutamylcyclotransferase family protein n=1 Tax=uncultured Litoreibacter sp. TaxID=1392394 RepID=UPI00263A39AA|nr:gamma-glutamylcyclotransferase family protein [uncultured Litoreibacter sp.]
MSDPHFFGYGSLVNAATHSYPDPLPATVIGWRRMWRHTKMREVAYLTVAPDPACTIQGLIAQVPDNDWAALDEREYAYFRTPVLPQTIALDTPRRMEVQIYQTRTDQDAAPSVRHPILLSYLDVVVQGYLRVFGEAGVQQFFQTTSGWDAPIRNDRAAPIYPRAQQLTATETLLVDEMLAAHVK